MYKLIRCFILNRAHPIFQKYTSNLCKVRQHLSFDMCFWCCKGSFKLFYLLKRECTVHRIIAVFIFIRLLVNRNLRPTVVFLWHSLKSLTIYIWMILKVDFALKLSNYTSLKRFMCLKWIKWMVTPSVYPWLAIIYYFISLAEVPGPCFRVVF